MPLTEQYLDKQRELATRDLPERCSVQRYTGTVDDLGEETRAWADLGTYVPCKVATTASATGRERLRLEALGQVTDWMVILPYNQAVTSKDRILITSGSSAGRSFNVSQVLGPHSWESRRLVLVEESS